MRCLISLMFAISAVAVVSGCSKENSTPTGGIKPRGAPTFNQSTVENNEQVATAPAIEAHAQLPPGHPAIGSDGLPAGHPPIGGAMTLPAQNADMAIELHMPKEFQVKPTRTMTLLVYAAPKVEGDPEDADVAVSALGSKVPLKMNVDRWCGQFDLPAGQTCETAARRETPQGTKYPTTLVQISGAYKGMSMMAAQGPPKENYKMVAAEILTPERAFYVKMTGPEKTVEHWRPALIDAIKAAR